MNTNTSRATQASNNSQKARDTVEVSPYLARKRVAVKVIGTILAILLAPILLVLIGLVRLASPGPGLYRQKRVGLNGSEFTIYKLRSMRRDAESMTGPTWASEQDARITLFGRLLRYTHLDELPQIINVARGEMDFVGPRPERPEFVTPLLRQVDHYEHRLLSLPGITGIAQVNLPPDTTIDCVRKKVAADCHYIQTASLWLDMRLIAATILRVIGIRYHHGAKLLGVGLPSSSLATFTTIAASQADTNEELFDKPTPIPEPVLLYSTAHTANGNLHKEVSDGLLAEPARRLPR